MAETNLLSDREIEILQLVATGLTNREIAQSLSISPNTVKVHLRNIFEKINVSSRTEATLYGIEHGIVDVPGSEDNIVLSESLSMIQNSPWLFMAVLLVIVILVTIGSNILISTPTPTPAVISELPDRWQKLTPLPEPRSYMAAASYDGNIFIIAGEGPQGVSDSVFRYVISEDRWDQLSDKPTPVADIEGVLIGEKIYIPGGRMTNGENTDILEVYNPRTDSWEQKASLPIKVSGYALSDFEGQIYLFGGSVGEKVLDIALRYDPLDDQWEFMSPMRTPRAYAGAASAGGKIYVIGGWNGDKALDSNESYSPSRDIPGDDAWQVENNLPIADYSMGVESVGDMIFIVGENGVWQFTSSSGVWNYDGNKIPFKLIKNFGFSLSDSYLFIIGGSDKNNQYLSQVYRYQAIYSFVLPIIRN